MILRDGDAACLSALEDGTVRAVVTAAMSPADVAARTNLRSVASLPPETRAIVVSRDGPDPSPLIAEIEDALHQMRRDGTLGGFSTTRFGVDLTVRP
jgi:ABC-type amino acid transport substrate-binding protein